MSITDFASLAASDAPSLDELALSMALEFRPADVTGALAELDRLGLELAGQAGGSELAEAEACRRLLGEREGFTGNREEYDAPANSMLDLVLERRTGLPILLSVVYVEVARRAGISLAGIGLPGHFVVGHFGTAPPLLLDPFSRGRLVEAETRPELLRPWGAHETALRMLSNLVRSYSVRGDLANAIRAAKLRLALPVEGAAREALAGELKRLRARLN